MVIKSNFLGLNVPEDGVEYDFFTIISIDSLLVYGNKYSLEVYSDNYAYKIVNTLMKIYLNDNPFEFDKN